MIDYGDKAKTPRCDARIRPANAGRTGASATKNAAEETDHQKEAHPFAYNPRNHTPAQFYAKEEARSARERERRRKATHGEAAKDARQEVADVRTL